ncbi:MAG: DUF2178 domain-containing protein [Nanobdellota archaeon]
MAKKEQDNGSVIRYTISLIIIAAGVIMNILGFSGGFVEFSSTGNWLIFIGTVMLIISVIFTIRRKKRKADERMIHISYKASRITYLLIIFGAFLVMVWDSIITIELSYSLFMSYMIAFIVFIYLIIYKILEFRD